MHLGHVKGTYGVCKALGLTSFRDVCRETVVAEDFCCREFSQQKCLECAPRRIILQDSPYPRTLQRKGRQLGLEDQYDAWLNPACRDELTHFYRELKIFRSKSYSYSSTTTRPTKQPNKQRLTLALK